MLERSRYIVTQLQEDWDEEQQEIMNHLFEKYPTYQKAYQLTYTLRKWYHKTNVGRNIDFIEAKLYDWCDDVIASKLTPFKAIKKMIEKHWQDIINYFKVGQTNAKAENMNSRIQKFLSNNYGIKDRDFFLYRLAGYFS